MRTRPLCSALFAAALCLPSSQTASAQAQTDAPLPQAAQVSEQAAEKDQAKEGWTEEGRRLLQEADAGDAAAQMKLAKAYAQGEGVPKDRGQAERWARRAFWQDYPGAEELLHRLCEKKDFGIIEAYMGARSGDPDAQLALGKLCLNGALDMFCRKDALFWIEKAAEQDNVEAQVLAAEAYCSHGVFSELFLSGQWEDKFNLPICRKWQLRAAENGDPRSMLEMGRVYRIGSVFSKDLATSLAWYKKAYASGQTGAAWEIGRAYFAGAGVPLDWNEAKAWFQKGGAHPHGGSDALLALALIRTLEIADVPQTKEAQNEALARAEQGEAKAQLASAVCCLKGLFQERSLRNAALWLDKAAEQGEPLARRALALLYLLDARLCVDHEEERAWNERVDPNQEDWFKGLEERRSEEREQAKAWLEELAAQGDTEAMLFLGSMLLHSSGRGNEKDREEEGLKWITRAAEKDLLCAQVELFHLYQSSIHTRDSHALQFKWLQRAAEQGDMESQETLGNFYMMGLGAAPRDGAKAQGWFARAAEQGSEDAKDSMHHPFLGLPPKP